MKKILLSIGLISLGLTSYSQDANVGLKVGIGWSQWTGADIETIKNYDNLTLDDLEDKNFLYMGQLSDINAFDTDRFADKLEVGDKAEYVEILGNTMTSRMSFNAGFQINSEINDYFWLKHEFAFATKGFAFKGKKYSEEVTAIDSVYGDPLNPTTVTGISYTIDDDDKDVDLRYRSYHVDILPVSLAGHYEGLQLFVGPYVSVMLASNWVDVTDSKVTTPGNEDFNYLTDDPGQTNISRTLSIIDYGYVAGFEYELPFGLNAGVRYMQGFGSVLETPEGESRTNAFNRDLRVSLGFTFGKEDD